MSNTRPLHGLFDWKQNFPCSFVFVLDDTSPPIVSARFYATVLASIPDTERTHNSSERLNPIFKPIELNQYRVQPPLPPPFAPRMERNVGHVSYQVNKVTKFVCADFSCRGRAGRRGLRFVQRFSARISNWTLAVVGSRDRITFCDKWGRNDDDDANEKIKIK